MRKYLTNKLHMYRSVKKSCEQHQNSWNGIPAFTEGYQAFLDKLSQMLNLGLQYDSMDIKLSGDVDQLKYAAGEKALQIVSALESLAHKNGDAALLRKSHLTRSMVYRSKRETALNQISKIIQLGSAHLTGLDSYGIVQSDLDELVTLRDAFAAAINAPQRARIERKLLNKQLQEAAKAVDRVLRYQLDKLVQVIHDPAFIADYEAARMVIDYGTRHREQGDEQKGIHPPERDDGGEAA